MFFPHSIVTLFFRFPFSRHCMFPDWPVSLKQLPVTGILPEMEKNLSTNAQVGITAEAGAGKSTVIPLALLRQLPETSKILMVQPRQLAAISLADRMARLLGETCGQTVGVRTRDITRVGSGTRLELMTWGVFLRILQESPDLPGTSVVILDEFHERHWQGDLGWAFLQEIREILRPDLRVLFLSTHLPENLELVHLHAAGRQFPVHIRHRVFPEKDCAMAAAQGVLETIREVPSGCILVFLPGKPEIERCLNRLSELLPQGVELFPLHRKVDATIRQAVFEPTGGRLRVVAATNIAETSLTLPDVRAVVDTGLERMLIHSPRTGMSHSVTVRISQISATQRAGRAGRVMEGRVLRLWPESETLPAGREPEILRGDPLPMALELALWGDWHNLKFLTPPPAASLQAAGELLRHLGFLDDDSRITDGGKNAARMGIHPRMVAMLQGARAGEKPTAELLVALLEEDQWRSLDPDRVSDWISGMKRLPVAVETALRRLRNRNSGSARESREAFRPEFCAPLLCRAYPDRVARVDPDNPQRAVFVSGRAGLLPEPLQPGSFLVAVITEGGTHSARISLYEPCTLEDILHTGHLSPRTSVQIDIAADWSVTGRKTTRLGSLVLQEIIASPGPEPLAKAVCARIREKGWQVLPLGPLSLGFLHRARLVLGYLGEAEPPFDGESLIRDLELWLAPGMRFREGPVLDDRWIADALTKRLPGHLLARLRQLAPEQLVLPSGRRVRVDYGTPETPQVASRLHDFFGCTDTPRICGIPVQVHLLSPAGRPVQVTSDLAGFWKTSYQLVRKEMAGRYPKHKWPENPLG